MFRTITQHLRWTWQRLTWGWDEREVWSLDYTFCQWIVPRLVLLKETKHGVPAFCFDDVTDDSDKAFNLAKERWDIILDEMIDGFKCHDYCWYEKENDYAKYKRAKELFCEHLETLWD